MCAKAGVRLLKLAPYSPDMNPMEELCDTKYAVHYDGKLGSAEQYAEAEPRGWLQKQSLSLEDEEQDGKGSSQS